MLSEKINMGIQDSDKKMSDFELFLCYSLKIVNEFAL
jgi:hypothetical protein